MHQIIDFLEIKKDAKILVKRKLKNEMKNKIEKNTLVRVAM